MPEANGLVALKVDWTLLSDVNAIKRAGVPILHSLNIQYRPKQHAREQRDRWPVKVPEALAI